MTLREIPLDYDDTKNPKYDANGKKINYDPKSVKDILDQKGRPKYDSKGQPINYDDTKYPRYDSKGKQIDYGDIDPKGDFDSRGRPKYDSKGQPISYDDFKYPKYDAEGKKIDYGNGSKDTENNFKINSDDGSKQNGSKTFVNPGIKKSAPQICRSP